MSKFPTKAAGNVFCDARCEAAKFNDSFRSREGTAEHIGIDRSRLTRLELGMLDPYPEEVVLLADAYNAPELMNHYCFELCPIGRRIAPKAGANELDRLAMKILASVGELEGIDKEMISIAKDGKVSPEEVPRLKKVMEALDSAAKAAAELKIFMSKNGYGGE